jgi:hypothetical protein
VAATGSSEALDEAHPDAIVNPTEINAISLRDVPMTISLHLYYWYYWYYWPAAAAARLRGIDDGRERHCKPQSP